MAISYDEVERLIDSSPLVHFGNAADVVADEWLDRAEKQLGVPFPPSYKWWLKKYGGGDIGGEEIYSVYGLDFENVVGGDIVFMNTDRKLPMHRMAISDTGVDEEFYFDTSSRDADGEYRVVVFEHPDSEIVYADNFLEFLRRRIEFFQV